MYMK